MVLTRQQKEKRRDELFAKWQGKFIKCRFWHEIVAQCQRVRFHDPNMPSEDYDELCELEVLVKDFTGDWIK